MPNPVTIPNIRFSYLNAFQPQVRPGGKPEDAKYSATILVPKSNTQAKGIIDAAVQEAITAGVSKCWNGQRPPMPNICVHDGDGVRPSDGQAYGEECKGCWVFTASSKQAPFVVDGQVQPIIDPREVYSGMWGNVNVTFFAYNSNGKKGVGCALNGLQKTRDDEALAGRITAEQAFQPVAQADYAPAPAPQSGYYTPAATTGGYFDPAAAREPLPMSGPYSGGPAYGSWG